MLAAGDLWLFAAVVIVETFIAFMVVQRLGAWNQNVVPAETTRRRFGEDSAMLFGKHVTVNVLKEK